MTQRVFLEIQNEFGIKRMDTHRGYRGGERSIVYSPEEQAQVDSLVFHLEGFKTAQSQIGKVKALRKVYEILQMSHHLKRDYYGLPSLAKFWKNFEMLQEMHQTFHPEALFWLHAIAILVLFKDTKSTDLYIPSYAMTIIEGLTGIILKEVPLTEPKKERIQSCSSHQRIPNTFSKKRKFSSNCAIQVDKIDTETQPDTYLAKRKTTGLPIEVSSSDCVESNLRVEVNSDDFGSISTLWTALAELLNVEDIQSSYNFKTDHLVPLTVFLINRYLHLLISNGAMNEGDELSQNDQLQQILNHLRSTGILGKLSSSTVQLIKQELNGDQQNIDRMILWCNLGVLESACFRNSLNQVFPLHNPPH
jgi:hypothetical protein